MSIVVFTTSYHQIPLVKSGHNCLHAFRTELFALYNYRLKNKVVVLCDDSVRRGTVTSGGPIHYARAAGVERIHMRIGTPRNTHYCRLDFRDALDETLPANRYPTNEEMAKFLGVDSIDFPTVDEFVDAILESAKENGANLRREDLCLGCYNGDFSFLA